MSVSWTEWAVPSYWRERLPWRIFLPVIVFLAVPSLLSAGGASRLAILLLLLLLVFQFRLWDDLGDVETDRIEFPERVLCRRRSVAPFYWLWLAVAMGVVALLWGHRPLLVCYLVTVTGFFLWYRFLAGYAPRVLRYHVVAVKYPIFVYFAAGLSSESRGPLVVATMALVYLTFVVYEPLHDPRLHRFRGINVVVGADVALWTIAAEITFLLARGDSADSAPGSVLIPLALAALALATASYRSFRREADCTNYGRGIFFLAFVALLTLHGANLWA